MTSLYVTEGGSFIKRKGGHIIIGRNNKVMMEVPLEKIEDITVVDNVHISSGLMTDFIKRGVPITWLSGYGKYFGTLVNTEQVDIIKHKKQFELASDGTFNFNLAMKVILAKINNQLTILRRYKRNVPEGLIDQQIHNIVSIRKHIHEAEKTDELMGYEGIISKLYFEAIGKMVPEEFSFSRRSKHPPLNPFNSMLSLGYSMLFNEILSAVVSHGLHPFVGFCHSMSKGHPALVSDLIEEWRAPVVDALVLSLVKKNMLDLDCFDMSENGCYLNAEGRKIFLKAYNKKIRSKNQYLEGEYSYRESIVRQCRNYVGAMMHEDLSKYTPLEIF